MGQKWKNGFWGYCIPFSALSEFQYLEVPCPPGAGCPHKCFAVGSGQHFYETPLVCNNGHPGSIVPEAGLMLHVGLLTTFLVCTVGFINIIGLLVAVWRRIGRVGTGRISHGYCDQCGRERIAMNTLSGRISVLDQGLLGSSQGQLSRRF